MYKIVSCLSMYDIPAERHRTSPGRHDTDRRLLIHANVSQGGRHLQNAQMKAVRAWVVGYKTA